MNDSIGNNILRGTLVITAVGVIAKLFSFLSEAILAAYLGTSSQSDAYYMVSSIQAVIYPMLNVGVWNVFLPVYKSHIARQEPEQAKFLANQALTFFTGISAAVVALLMLFAPLVVSLIAPGFQGDTRTLCIQLVRISAPMYVLIIAAAVYASMLQCHNKFLASQIREVMSHIPTILAALFLYRRFGIQVMAAALVAAGLLRLLIELPFVDWGYRFKPDLRFKSPEFTLILKRMPSALLSAGVVQLNTLVDKAMASMLPEGTVSSMNYGHKLMNVFSGLLSSAIATALYPQVVELIALEKREELSRLLTKILAFFAILMVPVTLACGLFRRELVSAVFQRGAFDAGSTLQTSDVFGLYCLGLFFIACSTVFDNVFYGHGNTKTPVYISLGQLGVNVGLNLILIQLWGINGLALATSLSAAVSFALRMLAVRRYVSLRARSLVVTCLKVLLASGLACMAPRVLFWLAPVNKYLTLFLSAGMGGGLYLLCLRLLGVSELKELVNQLLRKRRKTG